MIVGCALMMLVPALAPTARAAAPLSINIESRQVINDLSRATGIKPAHELTLSVANIGHWDDATLVAALRTAADILAQCRIRIAHAELLRVAVPPKHRDFDTPRSRELARALALPKPTLYFAAGTRQVPAFDAEAIGRGNSRTRPELRDTVWIARGARDPGLVVAHELAHVLMDSGEHDRTPGNLMAEATSPHHTQLTAGQCARISATGIRNGLLQPSVD
ncbi:MAG: hypothetical protein H6R21_2232 [Proteobacteria bacterium]|nr:hypothetical protein [Pseudomonadota bacterium]